VKKTSILRGALAGGLLAALAVGALAAAPAATAADINGWSGSGDTRTASAAGATATISTTDKIQVKSSGDVVNLATVRDGGELGLNVIGLNEGYPCKNGVECVRGNVVVDFGQQITNPKIKLGNLGGDVYSVGGIVQSSAKYTLKTSGVTLSSVGGNLDVTSNTITSTNFAAKSGTVQVNGTVSKVEFQITMRSKGAFLGVVPTWTKVPGDLHSIDIDVDKPTKPVLTVTKDDHRDAAVIGDQLSYDIVVRNTGDAAATNVAIGDDLPAGLTGITASYTAGTTGQVSVNGQQVRGTIPSLAPGAASTLTVKATVGATTPIGTVRNNACAVATSSNQACDWDDTTITKQTKPVLTIDKDDHRTTAVVGDQLSYDIVVRNTGDGAAGNVVVSDDLPAGLTGITAAYTAGTTGQVSVNGQRVEGTIPTLAPGASSTITVKATVGAATPSGVLRNNACAVATSVTQVCDGDDTTITKPALTISKDDGQGDVKLGQELTYDLVVRNTGDGVARRVVVSDPLPAGLDFVSGSGPAGVTVSAAGRTVTAELGDLAAGQSVTVKVNAKVNQSAPPGALTNQACAVANNASNVCDDDTDTVKREFFQYTFNSNPTDPQPGQAVTYRMEFGNNGNVDSANAEIVYDLAGVLDDSSWNAGSVTANSGTATVTGNSIAWKGPLASGQTVVITFTGVWNGAGDGFAFPNVSYYGSAR